jgi:hypothetical protein
MRIKRAGAGIIFTNYKDTTLTNDGLRKFLCKICNAAENEGQVAYQEALEYVSYKNSNVPIFGGRGYVLSLSWRKVKIDDCFPNTMFFYTPGIRMVLDTKLSYIW